MSSIAPNNTNVGPSAAFIRDIAEHTEPSPVTPPWSPVGFFRERIDKLRLSRRGTAESRERKINFLSAFEADVNSAYEDGYIDTEVARSILTNALNNLKSARRKLDAVFRQHRDEFVDEIHIGQKG